MNVTFLGTGTSQGIPVIGCDCSVCLSSDPRNKRFRSSIYVETGTHKVVIDTTVDFRSQCLAYGVRRIDAILITHCHADHVMGLDDIRRFNFLQNAPIPLYGSPVTIERLKRLFPYALRTEPLYPGYPCLHERIVQEPFRIGNTTIRPVSLPHGDHEVTGYLFEENNKLVCAYLTDCKVVPPECLAQISHVPVLILDALRYRPHLTHLSISEALEVVAQAKPVRTYFIHMCHELDHEQTNRNLPPGVQLAYDGLRIECETVPILP